MLDVLRAARSRLTDPVAPRACAVATIVGADGSVPRPLGTSMLVDAAGTIEGSLSGGCVEGAVLEACQEAMATGSAALHRFGYSDEDAFAVGLMCGGSLEVLIQPFSPASAEAAAPQQPAAVVVRLPSRDGARSSRQVGVVPALEGPHLASALEPLVPAEVLPGAQQQLATMIGAGRTGTIRLAPPAGSAEPIELFVESRIRPAHLVVYGANAFGQALVAAARPLGLRITLCDHRPAFTDPEAFPGAEVVRAWPHQHLDQAVERGDIDGSSLLCVLTHDPRVDVPVLARALALEVAYVGAMGSRRSDRERRAALREAGVADDALARLRSPIGLDLGAITPAEVAVSILAEILAVREGRDPVRPLSGGGGPLHAPPA